MKDLRRRQRATRRRTKRAALAYSILTALISAAFIIVVGLTTGNNLTLQALAFAVLGALLQTAVLGLLYEVLLRDEVENATLEKLNLSADVKRHGLVKMDDEATVDWGEILRHGGDICIVTANPARLIGAADSLLLERLRAGKKRTTTIAVPRSKWDDIERWAASFEDNWKKALADRTLVGLKLDLDVRYEVVSSGDRYVVILPPTGNFVPESSRLLEFRDSGKEGIGGWLKNQLDQLSREQASWGHAPRDRAQPRATPPAIRDTDPEAIS